MELDNDTMASEDIASLSEEVRRLRSRLSLVSDAGARITSTLDLPEVLQEVVDAACRLTDAQYGALAVFETNPAPCASSSRTASLSRYKNVLASFRRAWACSGGFRRPRNH